MGLVSLVDVKQDLRITTTDANRDGLLQRYLDGASSMITKTIGDVTPVDVSEVHDGGGTFIMLRRPPVLTIVSVTEYIGVIPYSLTFQPLGQTTSMYGYSFSGYSGKVTRRGPDGQEMAFQGGKMAVQVSYMAGATSVDPAIYLAVLEDVRVLWQQTQNGGEEQDPAAPRHRSASYGRRPMARGRGR